MNIAAAVLTFREGLEAALVVAIMLSYLRKLGRLEHQWLVWAGVLSASALAVAFTVLLAAIGETFDYPAKGIYEGITSLLAVTMLTYMIYWMSKQARYIKGSLEQSMKGSLMKGATWGLFTVAFLTVAREGVETALFLSASVFGTSGAATLVGGLVGLALAVGVAYAVYVAGIRLNMRTFFKGTSILRLIFGASILRYAVQEFEEVGWLPPLIEHVWNTGSIIPSGSTLGSVLTALIGYKSNPSLIQVIAYASYLLIVGLLFFRPAPKSAPQPQTTQVVAVPQSSETLATVRPTSETVHARE